MLFKMFCFTVFWTFYYGFLSWLGDHSYQIAFQEPQCITLAAKCGFGLVHVENFRVRVDLLQKRLSFSGQPIISYLFSTRWEFRGSVGLIVAAVFEIETNNKTKRSR